MGLFGSRRQQRRGPEVFIPQSGEARHAIMTQALLHFAVLHSMVSSDPYLSDDDSLVDQHKVSANVLGQFSPQELSDTIVRTGMIQYLTSEARTDPSLEYAVEVFEVLVAKVAEDSVDNEEIGEAHDLISRLPVAARAAAATALGLVMTMGPAQFAPAQTIDGSDGTSIYFDGTSQVTTGAQQSDTDKVLVYGNNGGDVISPESKFPWQESAEVPDETSRYYAPEGQASDQSLTLQTRESKSSEIASLLGLEPADIFEISSTRYTDPELSNEGGKLTIKVKGMTYNILGARYGKVHNNDGRLSWSQRLHEAATVMKQADLDYIMLQEVDNSQFRLLRKMLSGTYDSYPAKPMNGSQRPIWWDKEKFDLIDSGMYVINRYGNPNTRSPWIKLRSKDNGVEFYLYNIHTSAGDAKDARKYSGGRTKTPPPQQRYKQTKQLLSVTVSHDEGNDIPAIAAGDWNSTCEKTNRDKGVSFEKIPCTMMRNADFLDAISVTKAEGTAENSTYSTSHGRAGAHRREGGRHIDHMFGSKKGVEFTGSEIIINRHTKVASDHVPLATESVISNTLPVDRN